MKKKHIRGLADKIAVVRSYSPTDLGAVGFRPVGKRRITQHKIIMILAKERKLLVKALRRLVKA